MARVKRCPVCKQANPLDELFCVYTDCGTSLAGAEEVDEAPSSPKPKQASGTVRETAHPRVALEFPWGVVPIENALTVGRDPAFSPLARCLADNDYISARHAELRLEQGQLSVRDIGTEGHGSTNGTYVNGRRIEPLRPVPLADGDQVTFSTRLIATVRLA